MKIHVLKYMYMKKCFGNHKLFYQWELGISYCYQELAKGKMNSHIWIFYYKKRQFHTMVEKMGFGG